MDCLQKSKFQNKLTRNRFFGKQFNISIDFVKPIIGSTVYISETFSNFSAFSEVQLFTKYYNRHNINYKYVKTPNSKYL